MFPSTTDTASPVVGYVLNYARLLRAQSDRYVAQCDSGVLNVADVATSFLHYLSTAKTSFATWAAVDGLYGEFARQMPAKFPTANDAQNAFAAARAAVDDLIAWLEANIPVDASRRIAVQVLSNDGTGRLTPRTITVQAQLDVFRAQLLAFRDAFEA